MAKLQAVRTSTKCLVCRSPRRADADYWLGLRGQDDGHGEIVTWEYLAKRIPLILGRPSIGITSLKRHVRNCSRWVEDEAGSETETRPEWEVDPTVQSILAEMEAMASEERIDPVRILNLHNRLWLLSARRKLARGEEVQLTADQAARASTRLLDTAADHQRSQLLGALAGGISQVFERVFSAADEAAELPAGELIEDGEVTACG